MNIFKKIISFVKNNTLQKQNVNLSTPKKELIYDKIIPVSNSDTEGRQKIIRKLLKESDIPLSDDIFQECLFCECDIKEPNFKSKSKILEVFIIGDLIIH